MNAILFLIPVALGLGVIALIAFFWSLKNGQYDDLEGAKHRILDTEDRPIPSGDDQRSHSARISRSH
jgi:cbb3-type cytochrome oxidase maturation protein